MSRALGVGAVAAIILFSGCWSSPPAPSGKAAFPYPECEEALRGLRENANDPSSVEIVEWEKRDPLNSGVVVITVKLRDRNKHGAISIHRDEVAIKDGKLFWVHRNVP